ncbi:beta-glucan synthesis-associated [Clathrospora elynae]|uniref:Beta-glucan synthesis-associated n=1 Tax=Clathrospora elynae TaxID=706981 RepID=A0A6A5SJ23_9PLEO|nr:beta-glucan synthesis-associated [Clathrospora elynae]
MADAPRRRVATYTSSVYSDPYNYAAADGGQAGSGRPSSSLHASPSREAAFVHGTIAEGATDEARAQPLTRQSSSGSGSGSSASGLEFDFGNARPAPQSSSPSPSPSPFAPSVPSPLNPTGSRSASDGSSEERAGQSSDDTQAPIVRPRPAANRLHIHLPPRPDLRVPRARSTTDLAGQPARSPGTPLTLSDLGTDYTRYFSPFADVASTCSRRNSLSERRSHNKPPAHSAGTTPHAGIPPTNPFLTPNASTTKLDALYDAEKNESFVDDRLTAPYEEKGLAAWPLIGDQEEADDEMHMPREDDDIRYKPKMRDHFTRESIVSTIGLALMMTGLLFIFVGLPVLSAVGAIDYNSSYCFPLSWFPNTSSPPSWAIVNNNVYPLLANIRSGLIDPDTPEYVKTRTGQFGDDYVLVFSDEFNDDNRTFYEGDDPYWYASDIWYGATQDVEWYDPDAVTTYDGTLQLRLEEFANHGLKFRSGMLNSWNQLCFKGGIFEVSVSLPGPAGRQGLWPGAWTMGNLGRPGYLSTTDGLWPYTYQACDAGITPNQSSYDGMSHLPGQRLPSCTCAGEDHPNPGTGRGAPEIDIIEVGAAGWPLYLPIATQSLQVAPFDIFYRPNYNFTAFPDERYSFPNGYTGGPFQQALSGTTMLNRDWYDDKQYQRFSFEYVPGEGKDAYIAWKVGDQLAWMLDGRAIGPNGNVQARQVPEEPLTMILNLGLSNSWTWIDWAALDFPTTMRFDYVRWYQKKGQEMVTCDPPGFETTEYIEKHPKAYNNANLTLWEQTGYPWPFNKMNFDC